jgi:hypothetical protein
VIYKNPVEDVAADRREHRWFAAFRAASAARAECEALLEQKERIDVAWNHARVSLAEIEAIRDALGDELFQTDGLQVAADSMDQRAATAAA